MTLTPQEFWNRAMRQATSRTYIDYWVQILTVNGRNERYHFDPRIERWIQVNI
jgi:hypothetical protein